MSANVDVKELLDSFDIEEYLDLEGIKYKRSSSRAGVQLCIKECPVCGSSNWKVYMNEETGLGNCLSGNTEILTREHGAIAIEKVAGQFVTLLDGNGDWVKCMIHDHGFQTTYAAKFASFSGSHIIRSTAEHGWIDPEGSVLLTKDLRRKKDRSSQVADLRYTRQVSNQDEHDRGVIHGLIYGDGSKEQMGNYRIRICSHHNSIEPHLSRFGFSTITTENGEDKRFYIPKRDAWCEFKELPEADTCDIDYLIGFFRGWLATDGCVDEKGVVSICCGIEEAEWIRKWSPVIGWLPRGHSLLPEKSNFGKRNKIVGNQFIAMMSMVADDFLVEQHRERWGKRNSDWEYGLHKWTFRDTKEGRTKPYDPRIERVYCPEVPTTHSFALANGMHSRNCFAGSHPPDVNFNKWSFIKAYMGATSNREVVEHLVDFCRVLGWRPPKETKEVVEDADQKLELPANTPIPIKGRNLKYLENRGIDLATAEYFRLRFCLSGNFVTKTVDGIRTQDFDNRIIIPIYDIEGNLVSFQGRDITGKQEPKYKFPVGYAVAGRYLYNAHNAIGSDHVVVGEGVFDVWSIHKALNSEQSLRDSEAIGTFGKHLSHKNDSDDQIGEFLKLKRAGLKVVTMMWDSEPSAIRAAVELGTVLKSIGLTVRIATLPAGQDPNESTAQEIIQAIYKAKELNAKNRIRFIMGLEK